MIRVLVFDDYEPFRRYICATLGKSLDFRVVAEVSDGLQAVHEAEALLPDLILLDIGLPGLDGIEAARRIRQVSPESTILFVSQESSSDVIQTALHSGALGYVVKAHAASELLAAIEAVRSGRKYVSEGNGLMRRS
jgi:DNA-binding NarL/FixJ family response regulator